MIEANFTFTSSNYELEGTRGRCNLTGHVTQLIAGRVDAELWPDAKPRRVSEMFSHEVVPAGLPEFANYLGEVEHFAECVANDREPISAAGSRWATWRWPTRCANPAHGAPRRGPCVNASRDGPRGMGQA